MAFKSGASMKGPFLTERAIYFVFLFTMNLSVRLLFRVL
jgi:hypothetical protein